MTPIALRRQRIADAILERVAAIPASREAPSDTPASRARSLAQRAARQAATISGGAALLPGPFGLLSLLPDIVAVWKVQAQLVADIAAAFGKSATLTQEQMLYCLFKHLLAHGLRDLVVRAGERTLVRSASLQVLQNLATRIGVKLGERSLGKAVARYVPLAGAAGVATYAFYDTQKVAATAIELFSNEVLIEAASPAR